MLPSTTLSIWTSWFRCFPWTSAPYTRPFRRWWSRMTKMTKSHGQPFRDSWCRHSWANGDTCYHRDFDHGGRCIMTIRSHRNIPNCFLLCIFSRSLSATLTGGNHSFLGWVLQVCPCATRGAFSTATLLAGTETDSKSLWFGVGHEFCRWQCVESDLHTYIHAYAGTHTHNFTFVYLYIHILWIYVKYKYHIILNHTVLVTIFYIHQHVYVLM